MEFFYRAVSHRWRISWRASEPSHCLLKLPFNLDTRLTIKLLAFEQLFERRRRSTERVVYMVQAVRRDLSSQAVALERRSHEAIAHTMRQRARPFFNRKIASL